MGTHWSLEGGIDTGGQALALVLAMAMGAPARAALGPGPDLMAACDSVSLCPALPGCHRATDLTLRLSAQREGLRGSL